MVNPSGLRSGFTTCRCGIYLEDLYVTPEARRKGLGSALLARLANRGTPKKGSAGWNGRTKLERTVHCLLRFAWRCVQERMDDPPSAATL
jgi:GNAT superfamily N-acetyltransferase